MKCINGKYRARLFDAVHGPTPNGRDAVVFTWDLVGLDERVISTLMLFDSYGRRNAAGIWDVQQWARGWDGRNLDWFAEHLDELQKVDVDLDITDGVVGWILPVRREVVQVSSPKKEESPPVIKLVVDREALEHLPNDIEPSAVNAKTLFDAITEKTEREDANAVWTRMAAEVGPMQLDFTSEQWQQMIDKIRNLNSATFPLN